MNKKSLNLIGAFLFFLGGGAGVYFLKSDSSDERKSEEERKYEQEVGADLELFVVNLVGEGAPRYLRTTLNLGVKSEKEKEKIKELAGPIRNAVILYLTERKVEELIDPAGKAKLRADLQKQINAAIGKQMVSNVYFKEFLIQ